MCFYRTKLYKACGHTEFRWFMCNPAPNSNISHESDPDRDGPIYMKNRFSCGEQPQHVNDLELGVCGHCRKARRPNRGARRKNAVLRKEQSREQPSFRIFVPESDTNEPKHEENGPEQPMIQTSSPESDAKEAKRDEKTEDVQGPPADVIEERRLFKQRVAEAIEECRQFREEIEEDQTKASSLLDAIRNLGEYRAIGDKSEPPAIISNEHSTKPKLATTEATPPQPRNPWTLSHSATKVRRDLNAASGRVRSMIQAINSKSDVSPVIHTINHRIMATAMINTINRNRGPEHPTKPHPPTTPTENQLTDRPLRPLPHPDLRTLSKPAKLELLTHHSYHRLPPIPEESTSQALVVANSVPNTIVLRRAKAIKIRNLNAFHCPVRQPRFGLKRTVLAPPVPRHSTPPVAVPFSKFADLGRRRVSEMEWCFVV